MLIGGLPEHALTSAPSYEEIQIPEMRLMMAVLQEALSTFHRGLNPRMAKDLEAFREVDRWFRSRDYDWPFSFENICSCLHIAPSCVRSELNHLRRKAWQNRAAVRTVKAPYRSSRRPGAAPIHPPSPAFCSSRSKPGRTAPRHPAAASSQ
jgi:hypothetical protein